MRTNPLLGLFSHVHKAPLALVLGCVMWCYSGAGSAASPTSRPVERATSRPAPEAAKKKQAKKAKKTPKGLKKKRLTQWLVLGPAPAPMPAFHKQKHGKFTTKHLLKSPFLQLKRLRPQAGQRHDWFVGPALRWKQANPTLSVGESKQPQVAYFATYIEVDRYVEMSLKLKTHQRLQIFLDGHRIGGKASCTKRPKKPKKPKKNTLAQKSDEGGKPPARKAPPSASAQKAKGSGALAQLTKLLTQQGRIIQQQSKVIARQTRWLAKHGGKGKKKGKKGKKPGKAQATLRLTPGTHLLVIKSLYTPKCVPTWGLKATLHKRGKRGIPRDIRVATSARLRHSIGFLLRRAKIGGISLSPDGSKVLLWKSRRTKAGRSIRWLELRSATDGKLLSSTRPYHQLHRLRWSPDGKYYTFVSYAGKRKGFTIWLTEQATGRTRALRRGIQKLGAMAWSPTSRFLIVNIAHKEKASKIEKVGARRVRGMGDRWPWYRTHSHLYRLSLQGGQLLRLTAGRWGIWGPRIRRDGKELLFLRSRMNYKKRPFRSSDLYALDLTTLKTRKLLGGLRWINNFHYSPDGSKILLQGGASLFGSLGHSDALAYGTVPNEYDSQAYIYDPKTQKKEAISRAFKPAIRSLHWHPKDNHIYALALDRTRIKLYRYQVASKQWQPIPTGVDIAYRAQFAPRSTRIVYLGQGLAHPGQLFTLDLAKPAPRRIHAPARRWLSKLTLAKVKDFVTTSRRGHRIEGRVYYPPGFTPKKKYPAIVYYYGGTYPTTRGFDGRYPGHLWAAHGYVVYKLQPSGAIGYGQVAAARHVNEWGTIVPEEIIDATKDFIKAHPFVDGKRVGCIGASYGGFTTMSIVTKTKLFAAAISHAGISNITSYWGAGFWGFLYSAIAGAGRYPWSHPYFYVKQSPLFSANKVTTPLLLLHGDSDTNVPPAESFQMYTALRLLQKKVEIVLFRKSDHWILRYKKRILWTRTILAWFDRHLKAQPLWWKRLHGTRQH